VILVDLSYFKSERHFTEGVGVYSTRILEGSRDAGFSCDLTLLVHEAVSGFFRREYPEIRQLVIPRKNASIASRLTEIYRTMFLIAHFSLNRYEALFMPFGNRNWYRFDPLFALFVKKWVVTVHDLFMFESDSSGPHRFVHRLKRATRIIAISEFTKGTILEKLPGIGAEKIHVIHNAIENYRLLPAYYGVSPVSGAYVLSVNALVDKKNHLTLLKAFAEIKDDIEHRLIIVGKQTRYWLEVLEPFIAANGLAGKVIHLPSVEKSDLIALYRNASLFVTPSLREGFGFTPIEAAVCGAPVISSRSDALYETTRGLVEYYDPPEDYRALAAKMRSVLASPPSVERRQETADSLLSSYDIGCQARKVFEAIQSCRD